ncbi:MAG: hypothetical protein Q7U88_17155 [Desulfocapsaceae bacterium]|nr:hypothetical protein [Desulfocapsaceae bacterium]
MGKYLDILSQCGVKENNKRWYVKRAEAFIRAAQGRKEGILGWQFLQTIDAIQILLQTANAACESQVNWEYWRNSAQELTDTHPTIARGDGILPSTQNQALNGLIFFFTQVLKREIGTLGDFVGAKRPRHLLMILNKNPNFSRYP